MHTAKVLFVLHCSLLLTSATCPPGRAMIQKLVAQQQHVSNMFLQRSRRGHNNNNSSSSSRDIQFCSSITADAAAATRRRRSRDGVGFYYGLNEVTLRKSFIEEEEKDSSSLLQKRATASTNTNATAISIDRIQRLITSRISRSNNKKDEMKETLNDLRESLDLLRQEVQTMKELQKQLLSMQQQSSTTLNEPAHTKKQNQYVNAKQRQREFEEMAQEVEEWAQQLLFHQRGSAEYGWKEVLCSKMYKRRFNPDGNITCFLNWLPDPRSTTNSFNKDNYDSFISDNNSSSSSKPKVYPCVKVYATLDAPMEQVCAYLADESNVEQYNDLVVKHHDIEEIDEHSKICWGQSPAILFIKPRDFITFCHHRWKKDGTQVVINRAVDHQDGPEASHEESHSGKPCRAYALRGANFIYRDPDDPQNKTKFAMLAHADPGGGIPQWATKTAINAVAPIEPFKLFSKIEKGAQQTVVPPPTSFVNSSSGRSTRPGGLSQMGYAAFWPQGGGKVEVENGGESIRKGNHHVVSGSDENDTGRDIDHPGAFDNRNDEDIETDSNNNRMEDHSQEAEVYL